MEKRLIKILGSKAAAEEWLRAPVEEWSGLSFNYMKDLVGFYKDIYDWFDELSDERIIKIYKGRKTWEQPLD